MYSKLTSFLEKQTLLKTFLVLFWSFWLVHAVLRVSLLARDNAFGTPLVAKFEWYIFHAWAIDFIWVFGFNLATVFLVAIHKSFRKPVVFLSIILQMLLLMITALDHEVMRFLGGHISLNLWETYGNGASLKETFTFVEQDESVRYFPYLTLILSPWIALLLYRKGIAIEMKKTKGIFITLILLLSFWLFKDVLWRGGFREKRLQPVISILWQEMAGAKSDISKESFQRLSLWFQKDWLEKQGDSLWVFPFEDFPYHKMTFQEACQRNLSVSDRCKVDGDEDGFILQEDCNDWDKSSYPLAKEVVSNGVDEDCNGLDEEPWNVVVFLLETHRAVNVGFLKEYGATADGTPYLNSIAKQANIWTRFQVSGLPTIGAFISSHLGVWDYSLGHTATGFPALNSESLVQNLSSKYNYTSRFFSSADPSWDNQTPWLNRWFQGYFYDRSRERDWDMYEHMAKWMKDSLSVEKPFYLTSINKVNHYPFNPVDGVEKGTGKQSLSQKMLKTMKYTEKGVETLMASIANEPWFEKTLFVFMADHGFALGEHGESGVSGGLRQENTWVPFVVLGDHPKLIRGQIHQEVASQVDMSPTLAGLLGYTDENHFAGHNLLNSKLEHNQMYVIRSFGVTEVDSMRFYCESSGELPRPKEVYNVLLDPRETQNIYAENQSLYLEQCQRLRMLDSLNNAAISKNKIWKETRF